MIVYYSYVQNLCDCKETKKVWKLNTELGLNEIHTYDYCSTGAMLWQLDQIEDGRMISSLRMDMARSVNFSAFVFAIFDELLQLFWLPRLSLH